MPISPRDHESFVDSGRGDGALLRKLPLRTGRRPPACPPHHISRWAERDQRMLAAGFGFEVPRVAREPGHYDPRRLVVWRVLAGRFRLGPVGRFTPGEAPFGHLLVAALRLPGSDPFGT